MRFPLIFPTLILLCTIFFTIQSTAQDPGFRCTNLTTPPATHSLTTNSPTPPLSAVADLFQIKNLGSLLAANNLPITTPKDTEYKASETLQIPFPCLCRNDTGISNHRPMYTVVPDDGLYHIVAEVFLGLVLYPQIKEVNNITDANTILVGQKLWIPLPCSCDEVDGETVMHYGYLVASERTKLPSRAKHVGCFNRVI